MGVDLGKQRCRLLLDGGHGIGAGHPAQRRVVAARELDEDPGELRAPDPFPSAAAAGSDRSPRT